jgi:hypothetical protein
LTDNQLGIFLGALALALAFLPHWLDPVILWRERLEGWERPTPDRWFWAGVAALTAILLAGFAAGAYALALHLA